MLVHGAREKSLGMEAVVCFRRVWSPRGVVAAKNERSPPFLAVFQPEEANYQHCVYNRKAVEREADLTPSGGGAFVRRNRIIAGRDLIGDTLLL